MKGGSKKIALLAFAVVVVAVLAVALLSRQTGRWKLVQTVPDGGSDVGNGYGAVVGKAAAFSPDGRFIAVVRPLGVEVRSLVDDTRQLLPWGHEVGYGWCDWSRDGRVIVGLIENTLYAWNVKDGQLILQRDAYPRGFALSPSGDKLAYFDHLSSIRVIDTASGASLHEFRIPNPNGRWLSFEWSPSERYLFLCDPILAMAWDIDRGRECLRLLSLDSRQPPPFFRAADQPMLGTDIEYWGRHVGGGILPDESGVYLIYSTDASWGSWGQTTAEGTFDARAKMNRIRAYSLSSPDDILWDIQLPEPSRHGSISPDGRSIVVCSQMGPLRMIDIGQGKQVWASNYRGLRDTMASVFWTPDSQQILALDASAGGGAGAMRLYQAQTGTLLVNMRGNADKVIWVTYSQDGRVVVTSDGTLTHCIWERSEQ
jgi:WD40 repeat protein